MLQIIKAETANHYKHTRKLFERYADSLGFDIEFQGFSDELAVLPGAYAPPSGCILLAAISELLIGCIALRRIDKSTCEMKRLFVAPEHRGKGIGRALASFLIDEAKKLGYKRLRLDTVTSMQAANALYASLGFKPIEAYCHNPLEGAAFYELNLDNA